MTVEELISELGKYPADMEVGIHMGEYEVDIDEVILNDYFGEYSKVELR